MQGGMKDFLHVEQIVSLNSQMLEFLYVSI